MEIDQYKQYILFLAFKSFLYKNNNINFINLEIKLELDQNHQ